MRVFAPKYHHVPCDTSRMVCKRNIKRIIFKKCSIQYTIRNIFCIFSSTSKLFQDWWIAYWRPFFLKTKIIRIRAWIWRTILNPWSKKWSKTLYNFVVTRIIIVNLVLAGIIRQTIISTQFFLITFYCIVVLFYEFTIKK